MQENEVNWDGGPRPKFFYVDPPLSVIVYLSTIILI